MCGSFYIYLYAYPTGTFWNLGAAVNQNRSGYICCAFRGCCSTNDFNCGSFGIAQLYSTSFYNWYVGAAQIYQNRSYGTRYPVRGSYCNRGFECGTFYVELSVGISYSSWAIGAVLRSKSKWSRISISWRWI